MVALSRFFRKVNLDVVGFSASSLCALHCLLFPAFVLAGNLSVSAAVHNHAFENIILAISAIVGVSSLLPAYFSHHRSGRPLILFAAGMLVILLSRLTSGIALEVSLTTSGAALVALSHFQNWRRCQTECPVAPKASENDAPDTR